MGLEKCWEIPSGRTNIPAVVVENKLKFAAGVISYADYEKIGSALDHARVYCGDVNIYTYMWEHRLDSRPEFIGDVKVLGSSCGSSYDYETGRAEFRFVNAEDAIGHAELLQVQGLIQL